MAEPYLSEIRLFPFDYAPRGWALCNGALLPIVQNQALYSLLGTIFGGDGKTTFGLPDLRGRVPVSPGEDPYSGTVIKNGEKNGLETVTLTAAQMPAHTHQVRANATNADIATPVTTSGATYIWALADDLSGVDQNAYTKDSNTSMDVTAVSNSGGGQAHNNMQPYLTLNYCIAIAGTYPTPD